MQYVALGATDEIGASCHFLQIDGSGIMLDAGADPESEGVESVPRFDLIHQNPDWYVDHALITHAHHDHLGNLPVLIQHFPHVMAHMTPATCKLAEFLLPASVRLQRRKIEQEGADFDLLFDEEELDLYSSLYLTHELEVPFDVTGLRGETPVTAQFFDAGHILGSAGAYLRFEENGRERRFFYTSDTNTHPQTIIPGGSYPDPPLDVLLLETTSGADEEFARAKRPEEEERFARALKEVLERDGTALIPSFALGRAQEVLAIIGQLKEEGRIDADVPVYTAGSMRAIADLYDKTRRSTPRRDPSFKVFGVEQQRLPRSREATSRALEGPSIHVASSGMMFEPTLSNRLARRLVEDEKNAILMVGYAKEGSAAHRLQEAAAQGDGAEVVLSEVRGPQPLRCQVERFYFSGHSNRVQLLDLVGQLEPKTVLLAHGDKEAQDWMEGKIEEAYPEIEVRRPTLGEPLDL